MSATDRKVYRFAAFGREYIQFYVAAVPINQANVNFGQVIPYQGYPASPYNLYGWLVENVQVFCTAIVATATIVVDGTANLLQGAIIPVAGTVVQALLNTSGVNRRGRYQDFLRLLVTTNGTGTITNLLVTVTLRPYPLDGEAA